MFNHTLIDLQDGRGNGGQGSETTGGKKGVSNPDLRGTDVWEGFQEEVTPQPNLKGHM